MGAFGGHYVLFKFLRQDFRNSLYRNQCDGDND